MKLLIKIFCLVVMAFLCTACFHTQKQKLNWKVETSGKSHVLAEQKLLSSIRTVDISGPATLYLTVGANRNRLVVKGIGHPYDYLGIKEKNGVLLLHSKKRELVLDIELQKIKELRLNGLQSATVISKIPFTNLKTFVRNVSLCVFKMKALLLDITGEGYSDITVSGKTETLVARLKQTSQLNATALQVRKVKVKTYDKANAEVVPINQLFAAAMGQSRIIYLHRPDSLFVFPYATGNVLFVSLRSIE